MHISHRQIFYANLNTNRRTKLKQMKSRNDLHNGRETLNAREISRNKLKRATKQTARLHVERGFQ